MPTLDEPLARVEVPLRTVPEATRAARRALIGGGLDPDLEHTTCLLASELITNAVRHAGAHGNILLRARLGDGFARVEVRDGGPGFDPALRHEVAGFGLRLVDRLSQQWGVERDGGGCLVWFEIDRRRRRFTRQPDRG